MNKNPLKWLFCFSYPAIGRARCLWEEKQRFGFAPSNSVNSSLFPLIPFFASFVNDQQHTYRMRWRRSGHAASPRQSHQLPDFSPPSGSSRGIKIVCCVLGWPWTVVHRELSQKQVRLLRLTWNWSLRIWFAPPPVALFAIPGCFSPLLAVGPALNLLPGPALGQFSVFMMLWKKLKGTINWNRVTAHDGPLVQLPRPRQKVPESRRVYFVWALRHTQIIIYFFNPCCRIPVLLLWDGHKAVNLKPNQIGIY